MRLFSLALASGALIHLAWVFPRQTGLAARRPFIRYLAYVRLGPLLLVGLSMPGRLLSPPVLGALYPLLLVYFVLAKSFLAVSAASALARSSSPIVREQSRLILLGAAIAFIPLLIGSDLRSAQAGLAGGYGDFLARPYLLLPLVAFPLFLGYAVLRYCMLNTDYLLSRAALYGLLTLLVAAGYAILVTGLSLVVQGTLLPANPYLVGGEATFAVAAGPLQAELVGKRIPPGASLIGKSIRSRQGVIQNDLRGSEDWFDLDWETGFSARDLMVVPVEVKERVTCVLVLLNKRDQFPFTGDDLELIGAFAGQAAVAIENARLYTLTDQALAERVAELSVLQRIAHQLDAGLDLERVMHITLDWALDQSGAEAGLIGMVEGEQVRVMGARGYPEGADPGGDSLVGANLPIWAEILNNQDLEGTPPAPPNKSTGVLKARNQAGRPGDASVNEGTGSFLPDAKALAVVPIRREKRNIGVLVLESRTRAAFSEDTLSFLGGLSEQAAIAISNAQLCTGIQTANLAKSQFASSAAHELKNPLTSIRGYSDLLAGGAVGPVTEGQARFLATIRSNAERMSTLVSDLQDISRIEAGQLRLQFSAVSIPEAVDEVARTLRKSIEEREHRVTIDLPPDLPAVWCDATRLMQILTNLLSNACKYTQCGGHLSIQAAPAANQWDRQGAEQVIHFAVQDTGIGISPEDRPKIFQQFFRSEDPKVRELNGTGLGLTVSKNLVEMQAGKIWFESAPGQGTTFHFTIPIAETE